MKIHLLTVPLLMFLLASSALGNTCETLNPFIKTFNPYLLLKTPTAPNSRICIRLWKIGTCCKADELKEAAKSYNARMQVGINDFEESIERFANHLKHLSNKYKTASKTGASLTVNVFRQNANMRIMEQALDDNFASTQRENVNRCWIHLRKARAAALCNTCAADSPKYFRGDKAIITKEDCAAMITKCKEYFFFIIKMIQSIRYIAVRMRGYSHKSGEMKDMVNAINQIMPEVNGNHLIRLIESGKNRLICENLYNLNSESFIQRINPFFIRYSYKIDEVVQGVVDYCPTNAKCTLPEPRLLNLNQKTSKELDTAFDPSQTFASDVVVFKNADNIFDSHVGAKGSDSHLDEHAQPMNLTVVNFL